MLTSLCYVLAQKQRRQTTTSKVKVFPGRACLCVQQYMPRALPGWWKFGCRMQPSCAQCRLVTFTMPVCWQC